MINRIAGRVLEDRPAAEAVARVAEQLFDLPQIRRFHEQIADRRRDPRRQCQPVLVLVSDPESFSTLWVGWALNWSLGGIGLALIGPPVAAGSELAISWGRSSVLRLTVHARVAYCLQDRNYWIAGCEFLEDVQPDILELFAEEDV